MTRKQAAQLRGAYRDIVSIVHQRLGGRATIEEIAAAARDLFIATYGRASYEELLEAQLHDLTRKQLREKDASGLPKAMSIGEQYVIRGLMAPDEYRIAIEDYASRASANIGQAKKLADECYDVHGVRIDVADFFDGHYGVSA